LSKSEIRESFLVDCAAPDIAFALSGLRGPDFWAEKIFQSVGDLVSLSSPVWKNIFVFICPKSPAFIVHPVPQEGTSAVVTDAGTGRGGRGSVVARFMRAGERC
jgi:hypothetical protein